MLRLNLIDRGAIRRQRLVRAWRPAAVLAAAAGGVWIAHAEITARKTARTVDAELVVAEARAQRARTISQDIRALEATRAGIETRIALLDRAAARRRVPSDVLAAIRGVLPESVALGEIRQEGGTVTIRGSAPDAPAVAQFGAGLDSTGLFVTPVHITETEAAPDPRRNVTFVLAGTLHE